LSRDQEYRPEEGATHREQQILKYENFASYQGSVVWGTNRLPLQQEVAQSGRKDWIRIERISENARIPNRRSKLAAEHDLYSIEAV